MDGRLRERPAPSVAVVGAHDPRLSELLEDVLADLGLRLAQANVDVVIAVIGEPDPSRVLEEARRVGPGAPVLALVRMGGSSSVTLEAGAAAAVELDARLVRLKSELVALVSTRRGATSAPFRFGPTARALLGRLRRRREEIGGHPLSEDADQLFEHAIRLDRYLDSRQEGDPAPAGTFRIGMHARTEALMHSLSGLEVDQLEHAVDVDTAQIGGPAEREPR